MHSATTVTLTIERASGTTAAQKRVSLVAQWEAVQGAIGSGAQTVSLPGLSGSISREGMQDQRELLEECIRVLDGQIAEDTQVAAQEPSGFQVSHGGRTGPVW